MPHFVPPLPMKPAPLLLGWRTPCSKLLPSWFSRFHDNVMAISMTSLLELWVMVTWPLCWLPSRINVTSKCLKLHGTVTTLRVQPIVGGRNALFSTSLALSRELAVSVWGVTWGTVDFFRTIDQLICECFLLAPETWVLDTWCDSKSSSNSLSLMNYRTISMEHKLRTKGQYIQFQCTWKWTEG